MAIFGDDHSLLSFHLHLCVNQIIYMKWKLTVILLVVGTIGVQLIVLQKFILDTLADWTFIL